MGTPLEDWDSSSGKRAIGSYSDVRFLFDYLTKERPELLDNPTRVLDFGCGDGYFCLYGKQTFPHWTFVGVDNDESALSLARMRNPPENQFVRIEREPILLPFSDGSFDIVTAMNIYDYYFDRVPRNYGPEVARVARGIYAVSDFRSLLPFSEGHRQLLDFLVSQGFRVAHDVSGDKFFQSILERR